VKHILFISTHNLATNPRMVKEIDLALVEGYRVSLVCFEFNNWSKEINNSIKTKYTDRIAYHAIQGDRGNYLQWLFISLISRIASMLSAVFSSSLLLSSFVVNKNSLLILRKLRGLTEKVDLTVAHNIGSFYPAFRFARRKKTSLGIDIEDYHVGETNDDKLKHRISLLFKRILPLCDYITAASPLILEYTKRIATIKSLPSEVVLNVFSKDDFLTSQPIPGNKLELVWFSQYIAEGRGLEVFVEALRNYENDFQLNLIGQMKSGTFREKLQECPFITIHPPVVQKELHAMLGNFHVGLALEDSSSNFNRDICLTNKIFSYFQAGLFVLASDTEAQKALLREYSEHGIVSKLDKDSLITALSKLKAAAAAIQNDYKERKVRTRSMCWEVESAKLTTLWRTVTAQ
jgi:hypothetical protein